VDNATAAQDTVTRWTTEVSAGRLNPRVAAGLVPLMSLQLRAIEVADPAQEAGAGIQPRAGAVEAILSRHKPYTYCGWLFVCE